MRYISTRGGVSPISFSDAVLAGLAADGGLYVPEAMPNTCTTSQRNPYDIIWDIMGQFIAGDEHVSIDDIQKFLSPSLDIFMPYIGDDWMPLNNNIYMCPLFNGPTLAFKDVAMQFLGSLFEHLLRKHNKEITIIGATSGDTGAAAIEAFKNRDNIRVIILHPHNRVSPIQRRQMTTSGAANVHNIALEGSFDDCQHIIKTLFANASLKEQYNLTAVNSINWARIMAQMTYYIATSLHPKFYGQQVNYSVPTGNFGNVLAAYYAKECGLPINKLVVASNANDILTRFFACNDMSMHAVIPTLAPSMDIQISSNFERFLFDICERDSAKVANLMDAFRTTQHLPLDAATYSRATEQFSGFSMDDMAVIDAIKYYATHDNIMVDPHSVIALEGACHAKSNGDSPWVAMGTAHAAKFPTAIKQAIQHEVPWPKQLSTMMHDEEVMDILPNDIPSIIDYLHAL